FQRSISFFFFAIRLAATFIIYHIWAIRCKLFLFFFFLALLATLYHFSFSCEPFLAARVNLS
ncbi:hypothetical protein P5G65_22940, partial [Paenibacillus chondroitinus]